MEELETDEEVLITKEDETEETRLKAPDSADDFPPLEEDMQTRRPADNCHLMYFLFVLVAVGLLTPWNSFILAIDYFRFLYPTQHVENVIPYTELTLTLLGSLAMLALVNVIPLHLRIWFGYIVFILVLLFVPLMDIGIHNCTVSTNVGFGLTVGSVAFLAVGSGILQSSYYGLAGMLPPRYTQALMLGESGAGLVVSLLRVVTKVSSHSERTGAIAFFSIAVGYIAFCACCQVFIMRSKFVKYHVTQARGSNYNNTGSINVTTKRTELRDMIRHPQRINITTVFEKIKDAAILRLQVFKKLWGYALSTFLTLFVTLLLFPGITSDIQNCDLNSWPPVILATLFNVFDFVVRIFTIIPYRWTPRTLIIISCSRFILIPLFMLCVSPSPSNPILPAPLWIGSVLIAILGITNGYFSTMGMILGPTTVAPSLREIAGNMMTFAILSGLTTGAILATALTPLTELQPPSPCSNVTAEFICISNRTLQY